jgi:hypothetical protein
MTIERLLENLRVVLEGVLAGGRRHVHFQETTETLIFRWLPKAKKIKKQDDKPIANLPTWPSALNTTKPGAKKTSGQPDRLSRRLACR